MGAPTDIHVEAVLAGAAPATAANYGFVYTNTTDSVLELVSATERHETAGNDAGAVTLAIGKAASGIAKGSATAMTGTVSLKATADTAQTLEPSATDASRRLEIGSSICLTLVGTPTTLAGLLVQLRFRTFQ